MDRLLDGLTEDQRRAVTSPAPVLRILAGAGSGKTRVLTHRIAHQSDAAAIDPARTLALTFTRRAAGELRRRLRALGLRNDVAAGTFHAQAYAQLRGRWADRGQKPPALLDRRGRLLAQVLPRGLDRPTRVAVAAEIDWATAARVTPDSYVDAATRAGRTPPVGTTQIAEMYRAFADEKRKRRTVDFDDLLELCIRDLADPAFAAARHWRYRHLFVDEFQDVNRLQFDLLRAWSSPGGTLCVVGDPNQAIYGWNGADVRFLEQFERFFPATETVRLRDNFRSTPEILAAAAAIQGERGRLVAHRPNGPAPSVAACDDERHEAATIARRVRDRHAPGSRWSHQAVLVRTNAQTAVIAEALARGGIPFRVRDGAGVLDDARASTRLDEIARTDPPLRVVLEDLRLDADALAGRTGDDSDTDGDAVLHGDAMLDAEPPPGVAALDALARLAEEHLALEPEARGSAFAAWVRATLGGEAGDTERDAVDVVTFHAAKGLEWRVVHLAGLEDGLVPIGRATTPEARAEERRLFYVALTRAHDELHCTWSRRRTVGSRAYERRASPMLGEITTAVAAEPTAARSSNVDHVRALRDRLGARDSEGPPGDATLELRTASGGDGLDTAAAADDADAIAATRRALLEWRRSVAAASSVPPHVVCSDRTIDALALRRPADTDALADVPGLGPLRITRHGPAILAAIASATPAGPVTELQR